MEKLIALDANTIQSLSDRPEAITTRDIPLQMAVVSHPDTPRNLSTRDSDYNILLLSQ